MKNILNIVLAVALVTVSYIGISREGVIQDLRQKNQECETYIAGQQQQLFAFAKMIEDRDNYIKSLNAPGIR